MPRLNQIVAIEKSIKSRSFQELTEAHHALQKPTLLSGISRIYRPKDEEGEQLPPESTKTQIKADDILRQTAEILTRLFDVTATKDWANGNARADIVVDDKVLVAQVPVTYLLFLEKQLVDLLTFARKLPILDASVPRRAGRPSPDLVAKSGSPGSPKKGRGNKSTSPRP